MTRPSIGAQLKKARQKKEVTLSEVYQQTKIHPNVLSALEEDTYDNILNPIYMRSFLKRYAGYLGLDAESILDEYNNLHQKKEPERQKQKAPQRQEPAPPEDKAAAAEEEKAPGGEKGPGLSLHALGLRLSRIDKDKIIKTAKIAAISIGILLALLLIIRGTAFVVNKASQAVSRLAAKKTEAKKTEAKKAVKETRQKAQKKVRKEEPKKTEAPAVSAGVKEGAGGKKGEQPLEVSERPRVVSIPPGEELKLTVRVTNDVWIQLKVDGRIIFQNVLRKDSTETWQARESFEIWTGRAEAMYINLNGSDMGVLGSGVKKGIVINREGIRR